MPKMEYNGQFHNGTSKWISDRRVANEIKARNHEHFLIDKNSDGTIVLGKSFIYEKNVIKTTFTRKFKMLEHLDDIVFSKNRDDFVAVIHGRCPLAIPEVKYVDFDAIEDDIDWYSDSAYVGSSHGMVNAINGIFEPAIVQREFRGKSYEFMWDELERPAYIYWVHDNPDGTITTWCTGPKIKSYITTLKRRHYVHKDTYRGNIDRVLGEYDDE